MAMDYEQLLEKYMKHVFEFEDRTFTDDDGFGDSMAGFTNDEKRVLREIAKRVDAGPL